MKNVKTIRFKVNDDKWGRLVPIEGNDTVPFDIKRVYYIYDVNEEKRRGFHSHKKLEQVLICVHGSIKILVKTPKEEKVFVLDNPNKGLYIGNNVWREMFDWENEAVLLVLASEHYDESDYIRNYDTFLEYVKGKKE